METLRRTRTRRRARAGAVGLLLSAVLIPSALASAEDDPLRARTFEVRHKSLPEAYEVVGAVLSEQGQVTVQPSSRTLVVVDRESVLERVAQVLESFDVPPRDVEITLSLFLGTDPREAGQHVPRKSLSEEIRGVAETLPNFTKWTAYESLGSRVLVGAEGSRVVANLADHYRVILEIESVTDRVVRFRSITLHRAVPREDGGEQVEDEVRLAATVEAGKTRMVGAAKGPYADRALFLTLRVAPR